VAFNLNREPSTARKKDEFHDHYLDSDVNRARIGLIILIIPIIIVLFNDYSLLGLSSAVFYGLTALRTVVVASALFLIVYLKKIRNRHLYEKSVTAWLTFTLLSASYVSLTRPASFVPFQTILVTVYILVVWIAIPNRFLNQLILSLIITLSQAAAIIINAGSMTQSILLNAVLGLTLAYAVGLSSSWQLNVYRSRVSEEIETREKTEETLRQSEELYVLCLIIMMTLSYWLNHCMMKRANLLTFAF
jgi:hypothetical protein